MNSRIKLGIQYVGVAIAMSAVLWVSQDSKFSAWAEESNESEKSYDFTTITGDEIKNNPQAQKILKNIEIAKQRMEQMQQKQKQLAEQQKIIEEQRKIAKAQLEKDLERMNKEYEDFTPRNAFSKFVSRINESHHAIYWDQFDYMNEKIKIATLAKKAILENGGSYVEARAEFIKYASMSRESMIQFVSEINIKHGFTDETLQSYFDKDGKLPRYENDEVVVCYACDKYEKIKEKILADSQSA